MDLLKPVAALLYAALAYGCLRAYRHDRKIPAARAYSRLWALLCGVLVLLTLQNLTGVISDIAQGVRVSAQTGGWYETRRPMQTALTIAVALAGGLGALTLAIWVRPYAKRYGLAVAALCFLSAFTSAQAISLHQVDSLLKSHVAFFSVAAWCHAAGMGLTVGALWAWHARVRGIWKG